MSKRRDPSQRARAMAAELTSSARERAEEALSAAEEALEAAYDAAEDRVDEARVYLRRQFRDHPLAVAGVALGVGVVLGVLISSRR